MSPGSPKRLGLTGTITSSCIFSGSTWLHHIWLCMFRPGLTGTIATRWSSRTRPVCIAVPMPCLALSATLCSSAVIEHDTERDQATGLTA